MLTSGKVTQRLHALLGSAVLAGVRRDFLPSCLIVVFVLGKVERRPHKVQIDGAAHTWCFGRLGDRGHLSWRRCVLCECISSQGVLVRCGKLWGHLRKSYGEFIALSGRVFGIAGMAINRV